MTTDLFVLMTDWVTPLPASELIERALVQGYDGVEVWWPEEVQGQRRLISAIESTGAAFSLLAGGSAADPREQVEEIHRGIASIADSGLQPLHVTLHAGRDHWESSEHDRLAERIRRDRAETGLDVLVELHRSRMLFAAHAARRILERHPDLRVTFDVSHWLVVAETMLEDQADAVDLAIARADHVHARIGHPQGPQVNDPEAAEWAEVLDRHLRWWDAIVRRRRAEGEPVTFLAEFGPVDYAPAHPGTRMPLRDPESSNRWMQQTLRDRYGA